MESTILFHSTYDYLYKTYRCLYCHAPIALTPESLDLLVQEARDTLLRENQTSFFYLTPEQDAALRREVETRERGICLSDKQCLHDRCLTIVQANEDLWTKIQAADRRRMPLPNVDEHNIYDVYYNTSLQASRHFCGFCHNMLTASWPGFAYCKKSNWAKDCAFMHYSCFRELFDARETRHNVAEQWRRVELNYLTSDLLIPERDVPNIAMRHDRWVSLMRRFELREEERDAFIRWYAFLLAQKASWQEKEATQFSVRHQEEDLQTLVEQIANLSPDERAALRKRLSITSSIQECAPKNDACLPTIDMEKQAPLLFLNLLAIQEARERDAK